MTVEIVCPSCGRTAPIAEERLGKRVRCPQCKHAFEVTLDIPSWLPPDRAPRRDRPPPLPAAASPSPKPPDLPTAAAPAPRKPPPLRTREREHTSDAQRSPAQLVVAILLLAGFVAVNGIALSIWTFNDEMHWAIKVGHHLPVVALLSLGYVFRPVRRKYALAYCAAMLFAGSLASAWADYSDIREQRASNVAAARQFQAAAEPGQAQPVAPSPAPGGATYNFVNPSDADADPAHTTEARESPARTATAAPRPVTDQRNEEPQPTPAPETAGGMPHNFLPDGGASPDTDAPGTPPAAPPASKAEEPSHPARAPDATAAPAGAVDWPDADSAWAANAQETTIGGQLFKLVLLHNNRTIETLDGYESIVASYDLQALLAPQQPETAEELQKSAAFVAEFAGDTRRTGTQVNETLAATREYFDQLDGQAAPPGAPELRQLYIHAARIGREQLPDIEQWIQHWLELNESLFDTVEEYLIFLAEANPRYRVESGRRVFVRESDRRQDAKHREMIGNLSDGRAYAKTELIATYSKYDASLREAYTMHTERLAELQ